MAAHTHTHTHTHTQSWGLRLKASMYASRAALCLPSRKLCREREGGRVGGCEGARWKGSEGSQRSCHLLEVGCTARVKSGGRLEQTQRTLDVPFLPCNQT